MVVRVCLSLSRMCDRCLAGVGPNCSESMYFRNLSDAAAWPLTYIDHDCHMQMDTPSDWAAVEGYHFETLVWDWLHNVYLGIGRDLVASGILVLIDHDCFTRGNDLDDTLAHVHHEIRRACSRHGYLEKYTYYFVLGRWWHMNNYSIVFGCNFELPRTYFPCKPHLSKANVGGTEDYAVLGSRFKAATVKTLIWWLSLASQKASDQKPTEVWFS